MYHETRREHWPERTRGQAHVFRRIAAAVLAAVLLSGSLFFSYFLLTRLQQSPQQATKTTATNGASRWVGDTQTTAPTFAAPASDARPAVDPLFQQYYHRQGTASALGAPLTAAFPIHQGWIQFFASGALLLPAQFGEMQSSTAAGDKAIDDLLSSGLLDAGTGVVRLPLIQALLSVGSQVRLGGEGSTLSYVDLRRATNPDLMVPAPAATPQHSGGQGDVFIAGGTRGGKTVGHIIPAIIWSYINRADVSSDGWLNDFGSPLTEALPFTLKEHGSAHHMLAQVFWRSVVLLDEGAQGASGQATFVNPALGVDYLRTLGPPTVALGGHTAVWALGDTALLSAAGSGQATAHIGQDFPLTLLGGVSWVKGALWYQAQWKAPKTTGKGWAQATALTFTSPGKTPGWASFDVLAPDLARYLAGLGKTAAAVVYDVTRQRYYTYNMDGRFIMGSSMKVPIMLTFLNMTESQGREPDAEEMKLLTTMIENSDNDAAATLYFKRIGGAGGVSAYLKQIGISVGPDGLDPNPNALGYSTVSPLVMVQLLTLLHAGKVLTPQDRNLALYWMEHIESDQQVGVGDTAPDGAVVAMKDGWVQEPGPNGPETGPWAMNSSGIVTLGRESYVISVYTGEHNTLLEGQTIVRRVCRAVAAALT